ncbi:unnamed protein product [Rhizophagus irregularis]|nr:unnamed protein product [Rhizophagus irregularis]
MFKGTLMYFSNLVEGEKDKAGFNEIDEFQGKKEVNNTFKNEASFLRREIEETSIFIVIVKNSHLLITSTPDLKLIDVSSHYLNLGNNNLFRRGYN